MKNTVFEPMGLAGITLKNKIIRSATHEGMADADGGPTDQLINLYLQLAKGEVGVIITGYAGIQQNGKSPLYRMLMIDDDRLISRYQELTDAVHKEQTPIILQIAHCGKQTRSKITGEPTVAPSAIRDKAFPEDLPKELTEQEIDEIIHGFVNAIRRAKDAGFDGVQLHAAHGYLLAQFLSPYMNRRKDRWGGTTENRFRIVREIYTRARTVVGNYPILIKLNANDGRKGGMRIEEAVKIAPLLEEAGCAAIEVSCGIAEDGFYSIRGENFPFEAAFKYHFWFKTKPSWLKMFVKPFVNMILPPVKPLTNYNVAFAQKIKTKVSLPVVVVGGIASVNDIADILGNRKADCVSMSRPFIIEPQLVKKFREGNQEQSRCIKCNYCVIAAEERPLQCYYGKLKG
jgi:2,4-dienoyl-CoA reductase-like NADH-dependent reductase (Old Yellow Enzyme family)